MTSQAFVVTKVMLFYINYTDILIFINNKEEGNFFRKKFRTTKSTLAHQGNRLTAIVTVVRLEY